MKKDMKQDERRRQNNKGFSLVELIVVIAIMAVLVVVAAPQFTKYIDRSRQSVDATTVAGIVSAAQVGVADVIDYTVPNGTYAITLVQDADAVVATVATDGTATDLVAATGADPKNLTNAIVDACGELDTLHVTANAWDSVTITLTVNGNVTVTYASVDSDGSNDEFATYINGEQTPATTP